ncbi:MAG: hypothetical protein KC636_08265 [Myxococcales bacterium]|nr:hypothetical protein [Myxococcales bacterium]
MAMSTLPSWMNGTAAPRRRGALARLAARGLSWASSLALITALFALGCEDSEPGDPPGDDGTLVCSDMDSEDNLDQDGDGYSPCEGDCDDADVEFYPGAPDIDDDKIDNNCDNYDPEIT